MMQSSNAMLEQLTAIQGRPVYGSDGEKIGELESIFLDDSSGEPEWIEVKSDILGGLFGSKHYLVPVEGAVIQGTEGEGIRIPYSKSKVTDGPTIEAEDISEEEERGLYRHYGIQPSRPVPESQLPSRPDATREEGFTGQDYPRTDVEGRTSMSRHEEELRVGKRDTVRGQARLRKWVETAPAEADVELRRETAHVERQQVDRPAPGAQIGDEEVEVTLHEEEAVVGKETMERERVSLEVEDETERETVRDEVRREHVEVDADVDEEAGRAARNADEARRPRGDR